MDPATYKKRQAIIERTYGIIKRQWGFYFICTKKGIKRAAADVRLMFTAINLRRLMNILHKDAFKKFLQELALLFFEKRVSLKRFTRLRRACVLSLTFCLPKIKTAV
jgi:hypothetical protein